MECYTPGAQFFEASGREVQRSRALAFLAFAQDVGSDQHPFGHLILVLVTDGKNGAAIQNNFVATATAAPHAVLHVADTTQKLEFDEVVF